MPIVTTAYEVDPSVTRRQKIEHRIASRVVRDAIKAGYWVEVDNGGYEPALSASDKPRVVLAAMGDTEEDRLRFYRALPASRETYAGFAYFVYGNDGWDVLADYSTSLEPVLAGANALAESLG